MTTATIAAPVTNPLTPAWREELTLANGRAKAIRKASGVAAFNGWMTGFFAACSAPFSLFSIPGFLVTAGLAFVAYNEFQGRKRLLRFDPTSPARLGWNQIGFLLLIIVYCLWMIWSGLTSPGPFAAELAAKPELAATLGPLDQFDELYKFLVVAMYGLMIVLSVVFQGLNALYYFSRRKHVESYVRETPAWVLEVQQVANH